MKALLLALETESAPFVRLACALLFVGGFWVAQCPNAQAALPVANSSGEAHSKAEAAWQDVLKACQPPPFPEEWRTHPPTAEQRAAFLRHNGELAARAAERARAFYQHFPNAPEAEEARQKEYAMLRTAVQLGNTSQEDRLDAVEKERLHRPGISAEERFTLRAQAVQRRAIAKQSEGMNAVLAAFEKGAWSLQKDFPKRAEPYQMLMMVASHRSGDDARKIAQVVDQQAPQPELREAAKALLRRTDAVGKPLDIEFTAVDGRPVNLHKMQGKVVLVDFWATWCSPCVAELPHVKAAYDKLHAKGFEIVGISLDQEKQALTRFVRNQEMPWPQYFDGKGWENKYARQFDVHAIPCMWLVDKKGRLRDTNARGDLEAKVKKLLAE